MGGREREEIESLVRGAEMLRGSENTRRRVDTVRKRENAGAAPACKRKIYKLESPIKSVPAVTTSHPPLFHVERRPFVSFSPLSRSPPGDRKELRPPQIWTRATRKIGVID